MVSKNFIAPVLALFLHAVVVGRWALCRGHPSSAESVSLEAFINPRP